MSKIGDEVTLYCACVDWASREVRTYSAITEKTRRGYTIKYKQEGFMYSKWVHPKLAFTSRELALKNFIDGRKREISFLHGQLEQAKKLLKETTEPQDFRNQIELVGTLNIQDE